MLYWHLFSSVSLQGMLFSSKVRPVSHILHLHVIAAAVPQILGQYKTFITGPLCKKSVCPVVQPIMWPCAQLHSYYKVLVADADDYFHAMADNAVIKVFLSTCTFGI